MGSGAKASRGAEGTAARANDTPESSPCLAFDEIYRLHLGLRCAHMRRASNKERIAQAAAEAAARAKDKADKQAAKRSAPTARAKKTAASVRMKVVWNVVGGTGTALKTFGYAEKAEADADAAARTRSTGRHHSVQAAKVPMD